MSPEVNNLLDILQAVSVILSLPVVAFYTRETYLQRKATQDQLERTKEALEAERRKHRLERLVLMRELDPKFKVMSVSRVSTRESGSSRNGYLLQLTNEGREIREPSISANAPLNAELTSSPGFFSRSSEALNAIIDNVGDFPRFVEFKMRFENELGFFRTIKYRVDTVDKKIHPIISQRQPDRMTVRVSNVES